MAGERDYKGPGMVHVVDRNIRTLIKKRQETERRKSLEERCADAITRFSGSMRFVYLHLAVYGGWIMVNLGWIPGVPRFDPTFVVLAMVASVEAIFLSTFVLISQNRMAAMADQRADLDLQISLLTEHELTRLVQLVRAMAEKVGVDADHIPELEEISKDIAPEQVLERIEQTSQSQAA